MVVFLAVYNQYELIFNSCLGWEPQYQDIESIIDTAWKWHSGQKI